MASTTLFTPAAIDGDLQLRNRFVMAPMTRDRAGPDHVPGPMNALYYAQRAAGGAGLIVTEGVPPDALGQGYLRVPGLYTPAQVKGWQGVVDAVHAHGTMIFVQLMYVGRISHPSFLDGATPVSASAVPATEGTVYTQGGPQPFVTPRELASEEIPGVIDTYRRATALAVEAGFDGAELHATSGYLPAQFLLPTINRRTDEWGGTIERRARFLLAAIDAMAAVRGPGRVGIRIGPMFTYNDAHDPDPQATWAYVLPELEKRALAYLHLVNVPADWDVLGWVRERWRGTLIANGGYDRTRADADLGSGRADLVSFGSAFLANPDLPARLAQGAPLNPPDKDTFYSDGPAGYIDYPTLAGGSG